MLSQVFYFAMANAVLATLIAIGVWCCRPWVRRPAVLHLLWVLVLVRLMMPPVLLINASNARDWLLHSMRRSSESAVTFTRDAAYGQVQLLAVAREALSRHNLLPAGRLTSPDESLAAEQTSAELGPLTLWDTSWRSMQSLRRTLAGVWPSVAFAGILVWLLGAVLLLIVQLAQVACFRWRLARISYRSRVWQARMDKVAKRMGLRSRPEVLLVRATISPMLWGFGSRTCVLFPERLLAGLNIKAQNTLLAHELAHYRRGDQWVRLLEMIATVLFWWHPVLWWCRREIERSEEMCCDAWALKLADGCPRTYAEALLATVDFVSLSLPPAASGASHGQLIAQRITAIMCQRRIGNWFTPDAYPGIWALAVAMLLPCPLITQSGLPGVRPNGQMATARMSLRAPQSSQQEASAAGAVWYGRVGGGSDQPYFLELTDAQQARLHNRETKTVVELGVGVVSAASFSADGEVLAMGTLQGQVDFLNCATGEVTRRLDFGTSPIGAVDFSPDQSRLAVGTRDGLCKLVDLTGSRAEEIIRRERGASVDCVRFSPDGRYVAVLWSRRTGQRVEAWDLLGGRVAGVLRAQQEIVSLAYCDRDREPSWFVVTSDGAVGRWHRREGLIPLPARVSEETLRRLRISDLHADEILGASR